MAWKDTWLCKLFGTWHTADRLEQHVERLSHRNRVLRHDLKNLEMTASALHKLVSGMRGDSTWQERKEN